MRLKSKYCMILLFQYCIFFNKALANNTLAVEPTEYRKLVNSSKIPTEPDDSLLLISLHKPTYVFPAHYTNSINPIYVGNTPSNQYPQKVDFKFQVSVKVPLFRNILNKNNVLYFAYTQLSYWQAYNESPFFRVTNYQPEIFIKHFFCYPILLFWKLDSIEMGFVHQSNGAGGKLERTWNRIFLDFKLTKENWLISIRPWIIIPDKTYRSHNKDIAHFLGYSSLLIAKKFFETHTISLLTYNKIESGFNRGAFQITWSFPTFKKFKGYLQFFNGYGQSLLEYNHKTTSFGLGIVLNDWI